MKINKKTNEKSRKINGNHTNRERSESSQEHVRKTTKKNQKIFVGGDTTRSTFEFELEFLKLV